MLISGLRLDRGFGKTASGITLPGGPNRKELGKIYVVRGFRVSNGGPVSKERRHAAAARYRQIAAIFAAVLTLLGSLAAQARADGTSLTGAPVSTATSTVQAATSTVTSAVQTAASQPVASQPTTPAPPAVSNTVASAPQAVSSTAASAPQTAPQTVSNTTAPAPQTASKTTTTAPQTIVSPTGSGAPHPATSSAADAWFCCHAV